MEKRKKKGGKSLIQVFLNKCTNSHTQSGSSHPTISPNET